MFVKYNHCVIFHIIFSVSALQFTTAKDLNELFPSTEFSRHTIIKPKIYNGREKREIFQTREQDGTHVNHLVVDYEIDGKQYKLNLELNKNLIPKGYFIKYQENGKYLLNKPNLKKIDMCHYHGTIENVNNSWAAISTCNNQLSGVVYDGQEMHYIEKPHDNVLLNNEHILYKHSDLHKNNRTCGYVGDDFSHLNDENSNYKLEKNFINNRRYKRSVTPQIRQPYNANQFSRYMELILVIDKSKFKELGKNLNKTEAYCKNLANIINALYAPFNIFIALVGVVTWTDYDEIVISNQSEETLTNFLQYRRNNLTIEHPNDNAQLITKITFENGVIGKSLKGPICSYRYSGSVSTDFSNVTGIVASSIAHQIGHLFGMEHDTNECSCPDERCIMSSSSSKYPPTHWSSCSLESLTVAFHHGLDHCLRNKPESLFDGPVCGNGFVEHGEQCDCGLPEQCNNTCCNPATCMLHENATCGTGECCDLNTCQRRERGTLCRKSIYECDLPEYCTGKSEYCPNDNYKMDTESCNDGKAYCFHGACQTKTDQCKLLWGPTGKNGYDNCYSLNTKGTRHGHCGYNLLNQTFNKCLEDDVFCGSLQCTHSSEKLMYGLEALAIISHSFIRSRNETLACRSVVEDLGNNDVDPGLVPNGAKCGDGKMCVNQKCKSVESLRAEGPSCPNNCNNNGVCNNLGHCHCNDGFAPPYCDISGTGGSVDSGPASNNSDIQYGGIKQNQILNNHSPNNGNNKTDLTNDVKNLITQLVQIRDAINNLINKFNKLESNHTENLQGNENSTYTVNETGSIGLNFTESYNSDSNI